MTDRMLPPPTPPSKAPGGDGPGPVQRKSWPLWVAVALLVAGALFVLLVLPSIKEGHQPRETRQGAQAPTPALSEEKGTEVRTEKGQTVQLPRDSSSGTGRPRSQADSSRQAPDGARQDALTARRAWLQAEAKAKAADLEIWAPEAFREASSLARQAEDALSKGFVSDAATSWREATKIVDQTFERRDEILHQLLQEGEAALERLDASSAIEAFEAASALDPANVEAKEGLARAKVTDRVALLLRRAEEAFESRQWHEAEDLAKQALILDPKSSQARKLVSKAKERIQEDRFQKALGEAMDALSRKDFEAASRAISLAASLNPDRPEIKSLRQRLTTEKKAFQLDSLLHKAEAAEAKGDLVTARDLYRKAKEIDPSNSEAAAGLSRMEQVLSALALMDAALAAPYRLGDDAFLAEVQRAVNTVRRLKVTALSQKADHLDRLMEAARSPVRITITSDGATEVTIYRVGRLLPFERRRIDLRPGLYTLVGTRKGYRDVRKRLRIDPGQKAVTVDIRCLEPIQSSDDNGR